MFNGTYSTSGPAEPISSKVSRSQNLTVLSAEPESNEEEKIIEISLSVTYSRCALLIDYSFLECNAQADVIFRAAC